jgi:hypothetical protein
MRVLALITGVPALGAIALTGVRRRAAASPG